MRTRSITMSLVLASSLAALAFAADAAEETCPLTWYSPKKGLAEAKSRNRPIVMVFAQGGTRSYDWFAASYKSTTGKTIWRHVAPLKEANVVLIKVRPPAKLKLTAGASAQQVRLLQKAHKKLMDRYRALTTKYGVTRVPTVLFLSPDGQMIFKSYSRTTESTVLASLRHMHHYFRHYQQARALMEKKDPAKTKAAVPFGPADNRALWYASMSEAIAAARAKDKPIVAVFTQSGSKGLDWFGHRLGIYGDLIWAYNKELKDSGATLVKIAPPTQMKLINGTPYTEVSKLRIALKKMTANYGKWAKKYGVTRIPTVLFLSPNGQMVLKNYTRQSKRTVVDGLRKMDKLFADYKQMREMLKEAGEDDDGDETKKKPGGDVKINPKNDSDGDF